MAGFNQQVQVLSTYVSISNIRRHGYLWPTKVMPDHKDGHCILNLKKVMPDY